MKRYNIPDEAIVDLKRSLEFLSSRDPQRIRLVRDTAELFGVSDKTIYRRLRELSRPKALRRNDRGMPRVLPERQLRTYCEIIAALRIRTTNKKGRCIPTKRVIEILEQDGVGTPKGLVKAPSGVLKKSTVNYYLRQWGYDRKSLQVQHAVVRFQATYSNQCWQFDMSQSDFKDVDAWVKDMATERERGRLIPMLFSIVDDRSGVSYQEYQLVYGEDVSAALRFLFRAMSPKNIPGFPLEGIPRMIYTDNGAVARSGIFHRVLDFLGIDLKRHMPRGKGGRRTESRAKGKVERPFRTLKEVHETLYHFHRPSSLAEANEWLLKYLLRYNEQQHRSESHSRIEDWIRNVPPSGLRTMCSWERFCTFAREPEARTVSPEAKVSVDGTLYDVDHELAEQKVIAWIGLFDDQLYLELDGRKYGPFSVAKGPIPLHRFRALRKTEAEKRADRIEELARELTLPIEVMRRDARTAAAMARTLPQSTPRQVFVDPDPFEELQFANKFLAKRAIARKVGVPIGSLGDVQREAIESVVQRTLNKREIMSELRALWLSASTRSHTTNAEEAEESC